MRCSLFALVVACVFGMGTEMARADTLEYTFEGILSGTKGFDDSAGILAAEGLAIGSPLRYVFHVDFGGVGTKTLNDGTVVPYADDASADYFFSDYRLGSGLPQKDGGTFNAPSDPAEYNVGKDSLVGHISHLLGRSEDDVVQIFSWTSKVSDWAIGDPLEVYSHGFDSQGRFSFFFGDVTLTRIRVVLEPTSLALVGLGAVGLGVYRRRRKHGSA